MKTPGFVRRDVLILCLLVGGAVLHPTTARAQLPTFEVGPSVLIESDFSPKAESGFGLFVDGWFGDGTVSHGVLLGYARMDFSVATDELHRHNGWGAFSVRVMSGAEGSAAGVSLGLGAMSWDDVSETDPGFRSSADLEEMLLPGFEFRLGGSDGVQIVGHVRDQITGWVNAILDPDEGAFQHRVLIGVGVRFQ